MKKRYLLVLLFIIISLPFVQTYSQDIEILRGDSVVYGNPGDLELVLYAEIVNTSSLNQTVFLIRTENNLPQNWTSSLCFDINCYPPTQDTVYTTEVFPPNDTVEASVHFYPDTIQSGTGHVQIKIGTTHNPNQVTILNLTASTEPSAVKDPIHSVKEFKLNQNFPNPFNPTTTISFTVPKRSDVSLKVYNIIGQEIATLVNGEKNTGTYSINFNAEELPSGIYFYKITAGEFSSVRKMMLLK